MRYPTRFLQQVSVILIFILLPELTGCYSIKLLSSNDIVPATSYVVHADKKITYRTYNMSLKDSMISGDIYFGKPERGEKIYARIYLSSDSTLKVINEKINFPLSSVKEITQLVYDEGKTKTLKKILIIGGGFVLVASVISLLSIVIAAKAAEEVINESTETCSGMNMTCE